MTSSTSIDITFKLLHQPVVQICRSNGKRTLCFVCSGSLQVIFRAGTVESRIRQLVMKLEYVDSLILAHPFIKGFDQVSHCMTEEEVRQVAQGQISDVIAKRTEADIEGADGASTVYSTTFYIGLLIEPKPRALSVPIPFPAVPTRLNITFSDLKLTLWVQGNSIYRIQPPNFQSSSRCGRSTMRTRWVLWCETSKGRTI